MLLPLQQPSTSGDYSPPPTPSSPFEMDVPPPVYERIMGRDGAELLRQRSKHQKTCLAYVVTAVFTCLAYFAFLVDWYFCSYECPGRWMSTITALLAVSAVFYGTKAMAVTAMFYYAMKHDVKESTVFGAIIMICSALGFIFAIFSSSAILLCLYYNTDASCFEGYTRFHSFGWIYAFLSTVTHVVFLVRAVYVTYLRKARKPSCNRSSESRDVRVYTIEMPPSYFDQISPPPKYTQRAAVI